ncbi:hypothetical protein RxyAA322_21420 [Rubrobacter xylanophilus]|uniref:Uncharacterized protein n=1 Tax=Rubrobacter xylanophilus TaxID=49319 RepID=A0A510HK72_9ACTN|nr:hypothetical protein RxyAA322_21420 [Rubrobacter xylanophilus]
MKALVSEDELSMFRTPEHESSTRESIRGAPCSALRLRAWDLEVSLRFGHLRRKIDRPGEPSLMTTVRGAECRFDPPVRVEGER